MDLQLILSQPFPLRGIAHQDKFTLDIGTRMPESHYGYRACRMQDPRIIRPKLITLDGNPTKIITGPHIEVMLAQIVDDFFGEKIAPRFAADLNYNVYRTLYQKLTTQ